MKLNVKAFALTLGIVWGVLIFLATNINLLRGGKGEHMNLLAQFYLGYSSSFVGSIVGLVWGFVSFFIVGWFLAWLYNKLSTSPPAQS